MKPAWTDYPIVELGDVAEQMAPVRRCKVLSYDGDKYCRVEVGGVTKEIKVGYLYSRRGRIGKVRPCHGGDFGSCMPLRNERNSP